MSGLIEHAQRFEVVQLEAILNEEPQCQSMGHLDPLEAHGGPATHIQNGPCPHAHGLRCAPHVAAVRWNGAYCPICEASFEAEDFWFVEL